jgi:hypothetical protein
VSGQTCKPVDNFDKTEYKYGLSCGFWSNSSEELDKHVVDTFERDDHDGVFDLMDEQYGEVRDR